MAINAKDKRKIVYNGKTYYWFVGIEKDCSPKIHILTEDKKFNKSYSMADTGVPVTPEYIYRILCKEITDLS